MPPQRTQTRPPCDKRQLCKCSKCIAKNPQGRWYNRSTVWRHAHRDIQTTRNRAFLTCRDCAEEHQVPADEIEAHRRDTRSQRSTDAFLKRDAYIQDIADFSSAFDETECLEEELEDDELTLKHVLEDFATEESSNCETEVDDDHRTREPEESMLNLSGMHN